MNNERKVTEQVAHSAGLVLDHIMNTPEIQDHMRTWIEKVYPMLDQEEAVHEVNEGTLMEAMYYAATVEFHSRVLAYAIQGLINDTNQED